MADRSNPYELAFEAWLRHRRLPYVAVNEARRALWSDPEAGPSRTLKSLDYLVSPPGEIWLIDVKGRRFPAGRRRQYWRNWSTLDDLRSLARWQSLFGERARGLLAFVYQVEGALAPVPAESLWTHRGRAYGLVGVTLADYATWARPISPKWDTWALSAREFRRLAIPLDELWCGAVASCA